MRLLLIADTHVPKRARDLPSAGVGRGRRRRRRLARGRLGGAGAARRARSQGQAARRVLGQQRRRRVAAPAARTRRRDAGRTAVHRRARDRRVRRPGRADGRAISRHRRAGVRAQPHPVGHHRDDRSAPAQPGLADRPAAPTVLHVHDRDRRAAPRCPMSCCTAWNAMRDRRPGRRRARDRGGRCRT